MWRWGCTGGLSFARERSHGAGRRGVGSGGCGGGGGGGGLWVLLPPSSSDLWGVCGRRRRLWKQEVRENELFNVFKVRAGGEVITVSVRGSGSEGDFFALITTPLFFVVFQGFFCRLLSVWTPVPPPAL